MRDALAPLSPHGGRTRNLLAGRFRRRSRGRAPTGRALAVRGSVDTACGPAVRGRGLVALSVSEDGRVLVVQGRGGGRGHNPRATMTETASTVEIRVRPLVPADLSAIRCPAMARIDTL